MLKGKYKGSKVEAYHYRMCLQGLRVTQKEIPMYTSELAKHHIFKPKASCICTCTLTP